MKKKDKVVETMLGEETLLPTKREKARREQNMAFIEEGEIPLAEGEAIAKEFTF